MEEHRRIGERVRRIRRAQGMSLDQLSGLAGISKSFLSRAERGERRLDRRSHLEALSRALGVSMPDLLGQAPQVARRDDPLSVAAQSVPGIRRALIGADLGSRPVEPDPLPQLAAHAGDVWHLRRQADTAAVARLLPRLLDGLREHAAHGEDTRRAARLLVEIASAAAFTLRTLGQPDLGLTAAGQCYRAAMQTEDPALLGFANFTRAQAATHGGGYATVKDAATVAADELRAQLADDAEPWRVYGMLLLTAAWAAAASGGGHEVLLAEAGEVASRTDEPDPAGDRYQTYFGPTNVGIFAVGVAVEREDYDTAVRIADGIRPEVLATKSRQASFHTDRGRALAALPGREQHAADALLRARQLAPVKVSRNPYVREAVADMIDRAERRAVPGNVRRLAAAIGLPD